MRSLHSQAVKMLVAEPEPELASFPWNLAGISFVFAITFGLFCSQQKSLAQAIAPDNTLGPERSVVVPNVEIRGVDSDRIDGGAQRGANLFHSFQEFNIETSRGAFFSNPAGIDNILTRVTGANISNIDGVLGVLGEANLFLINPNGLLFGPGARLDVNGSFIGSTAESVLFEEYGFSAVNPDAPPMLTIGVPIGLQIGENPGEIVVRSQFREITNGEFIEAADAGELVETADVGGLQVSPGETLALVGGDVRFEGGRIQAPGADVRLGGLAEAGVVDLDGNAGVRFPEGIVRANLALRDGAELNVRGDGGGGIALTGRNLSLQGESLVLAGIAAGSTGGNTAGDITVDVTEAVTLEGGLIFNTTLGIGDGGAVEISSNTLELTSGAGVVTSTLGVGDAGEIRIQTANGIVLQGESSQGTNSRILSFLGSDAEGNAGDITLETASLSLGGGAEIFTQTDGLGNAGTIHVRATDSITLQGESSQGDRSSISSGVTSDAEGNAGDITLETASLSLGGGAEIFTQTDGLGNAGTIHVRATDSITLQGESSQDSRSLISSRVTSDAEGNAGDITLETNSLSLDGGAQIFTETGGLGNAGTIHVRATDSITLQGESSQGSRSLISSSVLSGAEGNAGDITLETNSLSLTDSTITTGTSGRGNAGTVRIRANDSSALQRSVINSAVNSGGEGDAGGVAIATGSLSLAETSIIGSPTSGRGNSGATRVQAAGSIILQDSSSIGNIGASDEGVEGNLGEVSIEAASLSLDGLSRITNALSGNSVGNVGAIQIQVTDSIFLQRSSSIDSALVRGAEGNGGGIIIGATNLILNDGSFVSANSNGVGNGGAIWIQTADSVVLQGEFNESFSGITSGLGQEAMGEAGDILIETARLTLDDGALLSSRTDGIGNAGEIRIQATDSIELRGVDSSGLGSLIESGISVGAEGDSRGITIETARLTLDDGALITATTFGGGDAGEIRIQATNSIELRGVNSLGRVSAIASNVETGAEGDSRGIAIETARLTLDGAVITASTLGNGDAGEIRIRATDFIALQGIDPSGLGSAIASNVGVTGAEGDSRGIAIETARLTLDDGALISATTFGGGDAGEIQIQATDSIELQGVDSFGQGSIIQGSVDMGVEGNAGSIEIATSALTLADRATINTTTGGFGDAGSIVIDVTDTVNLGQGTELSAQTFSAGRPGNIEVTTPNLIIGENAQLSTRVNESSTNFDGGGSITLNTSNLSISGELGIFAETNSAAPAGNLNIQPYADGTNLNISFTADGFISTQTTSSGAGGTIDISAPQTLNITGQGSITASTAVGSTGASGNILFNAETIDITDTAIAVDSQGSADGGNITIIANDLTLDNSEVTASTTSTDGGNITLDLEGLLFLHDESLISTTAGTAEAGGNGGLIDIDSTFIVAFPSEGTAGSDITANAFEGAGGSINIASEGLFGIEFQEDLATPRESASNDITVTSTFGDPGNLTVNSPEVDPTSALVDLPETGVEIAVQDSCQVAAQGKLAFYKIGRGGLPLNGSAAAEASRVSRGWTPTAEEIAEMPLANPDPNQLAGASFPVMPAGDLENLQARLGSVRFIPACRSDKESTPTQPQPEERT